jgi:phage terminase large subunit
MSTLNIPTARAFKPLLTEWEKHSGRRFLGARGGRGSGKSHFFAELVIDDMFSMHTRVACLREVQNSIKDSVKQLLEDKIREFGLQHAFRITEREIICPRVDSLAIFRGLQNHTVTSIKSLEGFNRALYEEAQSLSQKSLDLATPTFREDKNGTVQMFAWNPDQPKDPVDKFFRENKGDPDFVCVDVNYFHNPRFPKSLIGDMVRDRKRDPNKYSHIWLGGYRKNSESRVFKNWKVERFETPSNAVFLFGADWGFSVDPSVLVRCFIVGRTLFVDRCAWKVGCEIDRLPALFKQIPGAQNSSIRADSARPETISYMQRNGFSRMKSAIKGPGSVEDGIEFLKSYDIVVHPECKDATTGINHVSDELSLFSYQTDKKTGEITVTVEDKHNHTIDCIRYAIEDVRRRTSSGRVELM